MRNKIMTYIVQNIKLSIEASKDEAFAIAKHRLLKFFPKNSIESMTIYKTSIDARKKDNILFVYSVSSFSVAILFRSRISTSVYCT